MTTADGPEPATLDGTLARPLFFERLAGLESWLESHQGTRSDLWLKLAKKSTGIESVGPDEVVDAAICFGWIDGQRRALDAEFYLQRISPRRKGSLWSLVNVRRVEALTAAGRMRESGLAEVRAARADGRWVAAYPSQKEATVPDDLTAALASAPRAARRFEQFGRSARYQMVLQLLKARTPEVRAARLARLMAELESGGEAG
ncbi:YdeI family protein [Streptomyces sp. NPDC058637]|uniref:YdeI/OmpD-associated family protein n=1 Tax=Streptomyces sp. NPDC058637 TaxID=3346569 RepID=UPI003665B1A4